MRHTLGPGMARKLISAIYRAQISPRLTNWLNWMCLTTVILMTITSFYLCSVTTCLLGYPAEATPSILLLPIILISYFLWEIVFYSLSKWPADLAMYILDHLDRAAALTFVEALVSEDHDMLDQRIDGWSMEIDESVYFYSRKYSKSYYRS